MSTLAERFLARSGAGAEALGVRLAQRGEMWTRPGGRALPFEAVHEMSAERVAFRWRARFRLAGVHLAVVDAYDRGGGLLEGRVLGVRAFRARGPGVDRGEAMRYLAELAWIPGALGANPAIEWSEPGPAEAEVATGTPGGRVAVRLRFDATGDLVAAWAPDRPRGAGRRAVPTPWRGEFSDHRDEAGLRVPRRAEAAWELPEGRFTYWRAEITGVEVTARG